MGKEKSVKEFKESITELLSTLSGDELVEAEEALDLFCKAYENAVDNGYLCDMTEMYVPPLVYRGGKVYRIVPFENKDGLTDKPAEQYYCFNCFYEREEQDPTCKGCKSIFPELWNKNEPE